MKKQYILVAVLLIAVAALTTLSIVKWANTPKDITVQQAVGQRDTALTDLKLQKQINTVNEQAATNRINSLSTQVTTYSTEKATLCAQIKAAKLAQPLCK